ncbi:MAG: GNAT family N-acetyltransferase [Candidatus Promineifilaceae bacterium]|nr:GNAT family N-acetyltransferase [Candidatus Promineifilaceae bacterium]
MQIDLNEVDVLNNKEANRFEIHLGGKTAFAHYQLRNTTIIFDHTVVPPDLSGQGIGSKLIRAALDYAREQQLTVIPACPFVSAFIRQHPEYRP